jgi:hypothetical protein
MENTPVEAGEQPDQPSPNFRRWTVETVVIVVVALLAFAAGILIVNSFRSGDEVSPGEQLNRMIIEENRSISQT